MIRLIAPVALIFLAGCSTIHERTPPPIVVTRTVNVPVPAPCVPAGLEPIPEYPDTDAALRSAKDAADRYQLIGAGRKLRNARLREIEPIVAGCPKAAK